MKRLLFLALILTSLVGSAQPGNLDTVKIRNLPIKAEELTVYVRPLYGSKDSADIQFVRSIRTKLATIQNLTFNTVVTLDSIAGRYVVGIYSLGNTLPAGFMARLGKTVLTTIAAISNPVIQYYVGQIDNNQLTDFIDWRRLGKNILID